MSERFGTRELIACYRRGVFPMADDRDDPSLFLVDPDVRGVLPLDAFHIPKRLRRTVRRDPFKVTVDTAFSRVMEFCAEEHEDRETTWINSTILNLYSALHKEGVAHSVECWDGERLVGGLYGVALNAAFFGESMFSRETDASKVALVHLVARLIAGGFQLLDAQFHNPHLEQFGLREVSRGDFKILLKAALNADADFYGCDVDSTGFTGSGAVQRITQIS